MLPDVRYYYEICQSFGDNMRDTRTQYLWYVSAVASLSVTRTFIAPLAGPRTDSFHLRSRTVSRF